MRAPAWLIALLVSACSSGCGPTVDLSKSLQLSDVSTGWHDAGVVDGKNKLVPSVTFKLKNVSDQSLTSLQVNALFRRVSEPDEWGSGYLKVTGSEGSGRRLPTQSAQVNSQLGYTGTETRLDCCRTAASWTPRSSCSPSTDRRSGPASASTPSNVS